MEKEMPAAPGFLNQSVFFIPFRYEQYETTCQALRSMGIWEPIAPEEYRPKYLLSYAGRLCERPDRYCTLRCTLRDLIPLEPYLHSWDPVPASGSLPTIQDIRVSCFSTGIGFLEIWVSYNQMWIEEILNFIYRFKRTTYDEFGKLEVTLQDAVGRILPADLYRNTFFYCIDRLKYDCRCLHMIRLDRVNYPEVQDQKRFTYLLERCYKRTFAYDEDRVKESPYDMLYMPYDNDFWGGSQEGLANVCIEFGDYYKDLFLNTYKQQQLEQDYHFLYLLLLNQKYAAISYVDSIANLKDLYQLTDPEEQKKLHELNQKTVVLRTDFSFRLVSDDMIFQNVYSRMYEIMDIDALLGDIRDNDEQMRILIEEEEKQAEKKTEGLLTGIAILALFSALIDGADFLDRLPWLASWVGTANAGNVSTGISLLIVIAVMLAFVIRRRK